MMMEAQKKMLVPMKKKSEKQPLGKRSPLQNLNTLHFHKSATQNSSNLSSSSSSSSSAQARNGSLRLLRSSNSSSDASFPSSSSRKPKSLPRVAASNVSVKSFRSKENELPKKRQQSGVNRREDGGTNRNPICKTAERSGLSCGRPNPMTNLKGKKLNSDCTPVGISGVRGNATKDSGSRKSNSGSAASVKTPPVEASLSPQIQSKMVVPISAATPVCYGAGHLLSGVTDKRKCRRRGSLRGGCEKMNLFSDEKSDKNVADDLPDCLVPLPSEASVRWLLSPCDEGREEQGSDSEMKVEECEIGCGNASLELDLSSSPSILCGKVSELGSDSVGGVVKGKKTRIFVLSHRENLGSQCFLGNLDEKMRDSFLVATPNSVSNCISVGLGEGKSLKENNSAVSLGSLSSGNIIQTPDSDSSLYDCIKRLNVKASHSSSTSFEHGSIKETLDAVSMSSRSEMSIPDPSISSFPYLGLDPSSRFVAPIQVVKNADSVCSWVSSSTSENLTLSQMRISWRDGLEGRIDEEDELDCCLCLSDEEIDVVGCSDQLLKPYKLSQSAGGRENEPCISAVPKEKSPGDSRNACAESICTNGGDLAVSCDSDWTNIEESLSFQVK